MARRVRHHPEAKHLAIVERAKARNEVIQERVATAGFGFLILLYTRTGGRHTRDAPTYQMAVDIRDAEMKSDLYEKCWIIQKVWDPNMGITHDARGQERAHDRWIRQDEDEDL